ncbi:hypothetical protein K505DRAFT_361107 [Melanomma pulvis-pyrius CBS 109.77]|uniref:C2H2-type domain-containing protein n=1 Tax=Melanomma pulvis-pyrius CBS 109.77 TaxID=1314802 RepID=A0A6A6XER8_9PLEO|nr:hypothetical protein K505DRAFT_361107 [Melanomma pulvis-pyrius CBS 109.77]
MHNLRPVLRIKIANVKASPCQTRQSLPDTSYEGQGEYGNEHDSNNSLLYPPPNEYNTDSGGQNHLPMFWLPVAIIACYGTAPMTNVPRHPLPSPSLENPTPTPSEQSQLPVLGPPATFDALCGTPPFAIDTWDHLLGPSLEGFLSTPYPEFTESGAGVLHTSEPYQPYQTVEPKWPLPVDDINLTLPKEQVTAVSGKLQPSPDSHGQFKQQGKKRQKNANGRYDCPACTKDYGGNNSLRAHIRKKHQEPQVDPHHMLANQRTDKTDKR